MQLGMEDAHETMGSTTDPPTHLSMRLRTKGTRAKPMSRERRKYPEADEWQTPARDARNDKEQRTRRMREVEEQGEPLSEKAAQLRRAQAAVRKTGGVAT